MGVYRLCECTIHNCPGLVGLIAWYNIDPVKHTKHYLQHCEGSKMEVPKVDEVILN